MIYAKGLARWAIGGFAVFFLATIASWVGGYAHRTYECRADRVRIYVAAPGYEAKGDEIPAKLYALQVTRCTLPEQWGGYREPIEGYP